MPSTWNLQDLLLQAIHDFAVDIVINITDYTLMDSSIWNDAINLELAIV